MSLSLFFDVLIVFLLTVWIAYALYLGQRFSRAKEEQRRLTNLLEQFYQAVQKAQTEMQTLQQITQTTRQQLAEDIIRATEVHHSLQEIISQKNPISSIQQPRPPSSEERHPNPTSEEELIKALNALH